MARINILVPQINRREFSGGILCVLNYAKGLTARGHVVNVIPLLPSPRPDWMEGNFGWMPKAGFSVHLNQIAKYGAGLLNVFDIRRSRRKELKRKIRRFTGSIGIALASAQLLPAELQKGASFAYVEEILREELPKADVTVATAHRTALPTYLYGTGVKFYFAQHYEPYFSVDSENPIGAEYEAKSSYALGLSIIANSTWLKRRLEEEGHSGVLLCPNAIDHSIFNGETKVNSVSRDIRIISYGGRGAKWKGFADMAMGMRLARERLPTHRLNWRVYGSCEFEPNNAVASFEHLGFLNPMDLANAYRESDILLSASWYESFPLFPLEAMACGLPVITTSAGTEEYAWQGDTAELVQPRSPESIADALVRLVTQPSYREEIARRGAAVSRRFTWEAAVSQMEELLLSGGARK